MAQIDGRELMENLVAEETTVLVAKMGVFLYFFNKMENEMVRETKFQFSIMLWMLRAIKKCQMKVSQIRRMTKDLKNLTKAFYLKKCTLHKDIENYKLQLECKLAVARRSTRLAQDMGKMVKTATREAGTKRPMCTDVNLADDLENASLGMAQSWWTLLEKSVELTQVRIEAVKKFLEMIEKKKEWESLLMKLFLQAAVAAQIGKVFEKRRIELKSMEIEKMVMIRQKYQNDTVFSKVLKECEALSCLAKEARQVSEIILSEFSPLEKVEN